MSILSGIGQIPAIYGTGGSGVLEYYFGTPTTTNLGNPTTSVYPIDSVPLGAGVFLVSFQIKITNLDTAPVTFSNFYIQLAQDATLLANYQQQLFTLEPSQISAFVFSAVIYNASTQTPATVGVIYLTVSSGAFASTPPTITTSNVSIVKIV
jgi:hypothetical protein